VIDLGFFNRKPHGISFKEAIRTSFMWISLALLFNAFIWFWKGGDPALAFFTGYLLEKMLSLDNMFVFVVIFQFFSIAPRHQHRILFWGVLGAIVFRLLLILIGFKLVETYEWILNVFGVLLIYSSYKMYWKRDEKLKIGPNVLTRWIRNWLPLKENYKGRRFFLHQEGKWFITPVFLVLLTIEVSDIIFAIDSIPAIFAITLDPFIVFTSNIFAICGLRSLYFLLSQSIKRFYYLQHAISIILGFVGLKLLFNSVFKIPIGVSLGVIFCTLLMAIIASIHKNRQVNL
jgi:tellurite resistance protein TerC